MSQIISFRLDKNNPREAKAYSYLARKRLEGVSYRDALIDALIKADESSPGSINTETLFTIQDTLTRVNFLLARISLGQDSNPNQNRNSSLENTLITDRFIEAIRVSSKPGMSIE